MMKKKGIMLTKEQRDVLILACPRLSGQHLTNNEIGQRLGLPAGRVKTLIHQACANLGAQNRYEAIYIAVKIGFIRLNEVHTLDEIAELLSIFRPDMLRKITNIVCEELGKRNFPWKGEIFIRNDIIRDNKLTKREQDVIALVARGLTNKEIADILCMSTSAVGTFIYRACSKLGTHKRGSAVVLAMKRGEMNIGDMYSFNDLLQLLAPLGADSLDKIARILSDKYGPEPVSTCSY